LDTKPRSQVEKCQINSGESPSPENAVSRLNVSGAAVDRISSAKGR
jgi:hypothetical protein